MNKLNKAPDFDDGYGTSASVSDNQLWFSIDFENQSVSFNRESALKFRKWLDEVLITTDPHQK